MVLVPAQRLEHRLWYAEVTVSKPLIPLNPGENPREAPRPGTLKCSRRQGVYGQLYQLLCLSVGESDKCTPSSFNSRSMRVISSSSFADLKGSLASSA